MRERFRYIALTRGYDARVSPVDYERLSAYKWRAHVTDKTTYAKTDARLEDGKWVVVYMHRFITSCPPFLTVHHRDHDGLHNERGNLVAAPHGYNMLARRPMGPTGYYGVSTGADRPGKFRAQIANFATEPHSKISLGTYADPVQAARAYDREALQRYGAWFPINFPLTDYPDLVPPEADPLDLSDIPF